MADKKQSAADVRAKHKEFLFPSVATYYEESVVLDSGKGSRLKDLDGREYLDFFGGILTVSLGQSHPKVNAAVKAQIDRLGHVSTLYPNVGIVELAEKLIKLAPGKIGKAGKAFFAASGTEAIPIAESSTRGPNSSPSTRTNGAAAASSGDWLSAAIASGRQSQLESVTD